MAWQSGTATSPADLLQKIAAFIAANGWTQDSSIADGAGWRLHAHKGAVYVNIRASVNESSSTSAFTDKYTAANWSGMCLYLGSGYSGASSWRDQVGGPKNAATPANTVGTAVSLPQGAITGYQFFADATGDNIVVVVEKTSGIFTHMGWGTSLQKMGTFTGGQYIFASNGGYYIPQSAATNGPGYALSATCPGAGDSMDTSTPCVFVRADVDAFTGKWVGIGTTTVGAQGYTGKVGSSCVHPMGTPVYSRAPGYTGLDSRVTNSMTGQSLLLPVRITVARDTGGNSFIGALPSIFQSNACSKGFSPGAQYLWGADTYRVFPGPSSNPQYGFAVKQV